MYTLQKMILMLYWFRYRRESMHIRQTMHHINVVVATLHGTEVIIILKDIVQIQVLSLEHHLLIAVTKEI